MKEKIIQRSTIAYVHCPLYTHAHSACQNKFSLLFQMDFVAASAVERSASEDRTRRNMVKGRGVGCEREKKRVVFRGAKWETQCIPSDLAIFYSVYFPRYDRIGQEWVWPAVFPAGISPNYSPRSDFDQSNHGLATGRCFLINHRPRHRSSALSPISVCLADIRRRLDCSDCFSGMMFL